MGPPPIISTPLQASIKLVNILGSLQKASQGDNEPAKRRLQKKLKLLGEEGVQSHWWTQEGFDKEKDTLAGASSAEEAEEDPTPAKEDLTSKKRSTPTKDTTVKSLPFDQLVAPQDQCWRNPYRSSKYRTLLVHSPLTEFTGEPKKDKTTVAQWARVTAVTLFKDVGAPLEESVRLVGRCFPDSSRARLWYSRFVERNPTATYEEFMHAFVPAFTDPELARKNRTDLFNLRQDTQPFSTFTYQHSVLWYLVNPNASEADMVKNWELRLNSRCTPIFQKYLTRVAKDNLNPTYNHAVEHMDEKISQLRGGERTDTIFTIIPTRDETGGQKDQECERGCRRRRHPPGEECPAALRKCNACGVVGHYRPSKLCQSKRGGGYKGKAVATVQAASVPDKGKAGDATDTH